MAGKMSLSPTISTEADRIKAVQVKVPVVATVIQNIDSEGKMNFIVEPPGPENEHGEQRKISSTIFYRGDNQTNEKVSSGGTGILSDERDSTINSHR